MKVQLRTQRNQKLYDQIDAETEHIHKDVTVGISMEYQILFLELVLDVLPLVFHYQVKHILKVIIPFHNLCFTKSYIPSKYSEIALYI